MVIYHIWCVVIYNSKHSFRRRSMFNVSKKALYLSIYLSTYLSTYLSIYPSIYLSFFLSFYLSIFLYFYLSIFLSFYLSIFLYFYLSIFLSFCLSVCLSIYLSIYLSTLKLRRRTLEAKTYFQSWNLVDIKPSLCFPAFPELNMFANELGHPLDPHPDPFHKP